MKETKIQGRISCIIMKTLSSSANISIKLIFFSKTPVSPKKNRSARAWNKCFGFTVGPTDLNLHKVRWKSWNRNISLAVKHSSNSNAIRAERIKKSGSEKRSSRSISIIMNIWNVETMYIHHSVWFVIQLMKKWFGFSDSIVLLLYICIKRISLIVWFSLPRVISDLSNWFNKAFAMLLLYTRNNDGSACELRSWQPSHCVIPQILFIMILIVLAFGNDKWKRSNREK